MLKQFLGRACVMSEFFTWHWSGIWVRFGGVEMSLLSDSCEGTFLNRSKIQTGNAYDIKKSEN